jgi:hypothetical protein
VPHVGSDELRQPVQNAANTFDVVAPPVLPVRLTESKILRFVPQLLEQQIAVLIPVVVRGNDPPSELLWIVRKQITHRQPHRRDDLLDCATRVAVHEDSQFVALSY